jgi:hypothetical protein
MTTNPIYSWDFTIPWSKTTTHEQIVEQLNIHCKKWTFQLEESVSGYLHYQGRVSLKVKARRGPNLNLLEHWSATSNPHQDDTFYVTKTDTRVEGPWSDRDIIKYIPRQYRNLQLRVWQQLIVDKSEEYDNRKINIIYDPIGNKGKSTIAAYCALFKKGIFMPPVNDHKELLQAACDICMAKDERAPNPIFIDLPRAMDKSRLNGIYTAIETLKTGYTYDLRFKYKEWWIDSPCIWVFSNREPDTDLLSRDRWNFWEFQGEHLALRCNTINVPSGTTGTITIPLAH